MRRPPDEAPEPPGRLAHALVFVAAVLWLALVRGSTLDDPHYWDALGSYSDQVRILYSRGLDLAAYKGLHYVRPPLFTGFLALLRAVGLGGRPVQRFVIWLLGGVLVAATFSIAASLRGRAAGRTASRLGPYLTPVSAAVLCATNPLFLAEAGLVQADLPVTALMALAWALLLHGRTTGFVLSATAAVLTKEIAYSLSFPALLLLAWRHRTLWPKALRARLAAVVPDHGGEALRTRPARWSKLPLLRALSPGLVPGLVLLAWELVHRRLVGHILHPGYTQMLSARLGVSALVNNLTDGGRPVLWLLALLTLRAAYRERTADVAQRLYVTPAVVISFAAALTLPLFFPAALTRYMMPALPLLCALAAQAIARAARPLLLTAVLGAASLALAWLGSWHDESGNHIDCDPTYRKELAAQEQAARALAAAAPRRVLSTFPMYTVLTAPPEDGFLNAPLPAVVVFGGEPLAELCRADYLLWTNLGEPADAAVATLEAAHALTPWREIRSGKSRIRIYQIRCPIR
ncbi:MAG: hypothetical protein U1A78_12470 [Polyangia bacterium]